MNSGETKNAESRIRSATSALLTKGKEIRTLRRFDREKKPMSDKQLYINGLTEEAHRRRARRDGGR